MIDCCQCCAKILTFFGDGDFEFCTTVSVIFLTDCLSDFSFNANDNDYFTPKQIADIMNVQNKKSFLMTHFNTRSEV